VCHPQQDRLRGVSLWYDRRLQGDEFEGADRIGYVMVCDPDRALAEALAERYVAQARAEVAQSCL
jgi:hypothetical protein